VNLLMLPMVQCVMMAMAMLRRRTMYASAESVLAAALVLFVAAHQVNARQQLFALALVVVVHLRINLWVLIVMTATPARQMTNVMATAFVQERMRAIVKPERVVMALLCSM
jgi:hypothetical protein